VRRCCSNDTTGTLTHTPTHTLQFHIWNDSVAQIRQSQTSQTSVNTPSLYRLQITHACVTDETQSTQMYCTATALHRHTQVETSSNDTLNTYSACDIMWSLHCHQITQKITPLVRV